MRIETDNLQSIDKRQGRVFSDGPSELSDKSRRTDERGPQRQRSAGYEVPSCLVKADNRASEQGNLFADPSHHGDYEYVPQGNADHRENLPKVVEEEEKLVPTSVLKLNPKLEKLEKGSSTIWGMGSITNIIGVTR